MLPLFASGQRFTNWLPLCSVPGNDADARVARTNGARMLSRSSLGCSLPQPLKRVEFRVNIGLAVFAFGEGKIGSLAMRSLQPERYLPTSVGLVGIAFNHSIS